jgi:hydrogenase expression/formation protein HypC
MCVSYPALVLSVAGDTALVDLRGVQRRVPLVVLASAGVVVEPGNWLAVHTGLAVARLTAAEAARQQSLLDGVDHEYT